MPDSVRHNQKFVDTMHKLHSEIERNVYAAEIMCHTETSQINNICAGCEFGFGTVCALRGIRDLIGDTIFQHDTEKP